MFMCLYMLVCVYVQKYRMCDGLDDGALSIERPQFFSRPFLFLHYYIPAGIHDAVEDAQTEPRERERWSLPRCFLS